MRQLILMRHGKAETASSQGDHARPLSPRGHTEAAEAGRRLAAVATPGLALVSDSLRTRQTFECVASALTPPPPADFTRSIYGVTADSLLAAVRSTPDAVGCLFVVGHNPGSGDLARRLSASGDAESLEALARGFPTSCFAVIDLDGDRWAEVDAPGRLRFLLPAAERAGG